MLFSVVWSQQAPLGETPGLRGGRRQICLHGRRRKDEPASCSWHSFLFLPFGNEIGKLWITAKIFLDKFAFGDNLQSASSGYVENRPNERSANTATSEVVSHEGVYQFKSAIGDCVVHESRFAVDDRLEALAAFVIGDFQHEQPLFP